MFTLTVFLIIRVLFASKSCPDDTWDILKNHCYKILPIKSSWHKGKFDCERLGSLLVRIDDETENKFVNDLRKKADWNANTWTGLADLNSGCLNIKIISNNIVLLLRRKF